MAEADADIEKSSETNARRRCFDCEPVHGHKYFLLLGCADGEISYYSKGVAWSGDEEIRVARLVKASEVVQLYSRKRDSLAIINSREEFDIWMQHWRCHALIEQDIWQSVAFEH